jgi:hypothetical protein
MHYRLVSEQADARTLPEPLIEIQLIPRPAVERGSVQVGHPLLTIDRILSRTWSLHSARHTSDLPESSVARSLCPLAVPNLTSAMDLVPPLSTSWSGRSIELLTSR